jgi:hypothetical protein
LFLNGDVIDTADDRKILLVIFYSAFFHEISKARNFVVCNQIHSVSSRLH